MQDKRTNAEKHKNANTTQTKQQTQTRTTKLKNREKQQNRTLQCRSENRRKENNTKNNFVSLGQSLNDNLKYIKDIKREEIEVQMFRKILETLEKKIIK